MSINSKRRIMMRASLALAAVGGAWWMRVASNAITPQQANEKQADLAVPGPDADKQHSVTQTKVNQSKVAQYINPDANVADQLFKVENFNQNFMDDTWLNVNDMPVAKTVLQRLLRVQKTVGYANFNLISFGELLLFARRYTTIGEFSLQEKAFMEKIFFSDAHQYGFLGEKVLTNLTDEISKSSTTKIPGSGHYLYKGDALTMYRKIKHDIGDKLILTSGVRSVVKQMQLFLAKLVKSNGNLSLASRSLAPPGHSYHGIGDFDVGKQGLGEMNFSSDFAKTDEFKKLCDLEYIDIRYTTNNLLGVRYEPWHIKVV